MNTVRLYFFLFIFMSSCQGVLGQVLKPAAVVGDEIITEKDLKDRISFIFLASDQALPKDPGMLHQIRHDVLKLMIDEALKRQTAARFKLLPENEQVQAAIENIAKQNGKDAKALKEFIENQGISFDVFRQHIIAELAWRRYLRERYGPAVRISDQELEEVQKRLECGQSIPGLGRLDLALYTYGQVTFPLSETAPPRDIEQKMNQAESLRASAKSLESLKERTCSLPSAEYIEKELAPENEILPVVVNFLGSLSPGESTQPIRSEKGIVFFFLKERREVRGAVPDLGQIRRAIMDERLQRFSTKALQELSRSVFIEIRG